MRRLLPSLMLALLVGCSPRLNLERKLIELSTEGVTFNLDPVKAEQKIYVDATATGGAIDVYIYLTKNEADAKNDIFTKKNDNFLERAEDKETVSLQATIPANEKATVLVKATNLKKPTATVEIRNKPK